jgi:phosphonate metabolism protein PhnN/1,5-bisphosphokinase (PRPP-forming)
MAAGALVLVVGPSGAGKDTLIAGAKAALGEDGRFVFPRRIVTRQAVAALEDHDSVAPEVFAAAKARGAYALDWQAHGLSYGLPIALEAEMAAGRVVVANVSRHVVPAALEKYGNGHVLLVTARPEIRAARLSGRGRESAEDVAARLRREGPLMPAGVAVEEIDNSGTLDEGIGRFTQALLRIIG